MKILIIGGKGMLGHKLFQVLSKKYDVWTTIRDSFNDNTDSLYLKKAKVFENIDVQNFETVDKIINSLEPKVIINAVGVIKQKKESKDIVKTLEINSVFPHKVVEIAKKINARFITFSTDCVFDGKRGNYSELDIPNVRDLYGISKNLGEVVSENCLTFRTSIIGREISTTNSLVEWFLSQEGKKVEGFINAIYTGFPTIIISEIISNIIENHQDLQGLYHLSSDPINKFDLLVLMKNRLNLNLEIEPFQDFKIDRSLNSQKFRNETSFKPQSWEKMVDILCSDQTPYHKIRNSD